MLPKLTEVFMIEKISDPHPPIRGGGFSAAAGKGGGPAAGGTNGKFSPASGDPLKAGPPAERYESKAGGYFFYKQGPQSYQGFFLSRQGKLDLLEDCGSRQEMVDQILAHHDKRAGGI